MRLSIITPVLNEESNINNYYKSLHRVNKLDEAILPQEQKTAIIEEFIDTKPEASKFIVIFLHNALGGVISPSVSTLIRAL